MSLGAVAVQDTEGLANYALDVARGAVQGAESFGSFGLRTALNAVTEQVLWPDGAFVLPPAAGLEMTVVSSSAQDSAAGTGIKSVDVHYLTPALEPAVVNVNLNGLTNVVITGIPMRFIQCVHATAWGSSSTTKRAIGNITVFNGAQIYGMIAIGQNRCTSSARMVPAGKRFLLRGAYASSVSPGSAETLVSVGSTHFDGHDFSADSVFLPLAAVGFQDNGLATMFDPPLPFDEGSCVALLYTQTSTATVTGGYFGWTEDV